MEMALSKSCAQFTAAKGATPMPQDVKNSFSRRRSWAMPMARTLG